MMRHGKAVLSHETWGRRKEWVKQTLNLTCNSFPKNSFNFERYSVLQREFMLVQQAGSLLKKRCQAKVQFNLQTSTCETWLPKLYLRFTAAVLQQLNSQPQSSWFGKAFLEYFFHFIMFLFDFHSRCAFKLYSPFPGKWLQFKPRVHNPWTWSCLTMSSSEQLSQWKQGWARGTQHSLRPLFSRPSPFQGQQNSYCRNAIFCMGLECI